MEDNKKFFRCDYDTLQIYVKNNDLVETYDFMSSLFKTKEGELRAYTAHGFVVDEYYIYDDPNCETISFVNKLFK